MGTNRLTEIWKYLAGENRISCGKSGFRTYKLSQSDRSIHGLILGASGTGKSRLALHLATESLRVGEGVGLVDPKGDLFQKYLCAIYKHLKNQKVVPAGKYVLFDPTSDYRLPGFNPLEVEEGEEPYPQAMALMDVFEKIWSRFVGPRMLNILRNTILTLMKNNLTLLEVEPFLTDPDMREMLARNLDNEQIKHFWLKRFPNIPEQERSIWVEPVLNKVSAFVTSPVIAELVGQRHTTIDFRRILDKGKTLVINLPKSKLGPEVSYLLGALLVAKINQAAISRSNLPEEERNQYHIYVDEFQNYASPSFTEVLSEARGFALSLHMITQDLEGVDERLRASILANAKLLYSLRVSRSDAEIMARHLFEATGQDYKFVPDQDAWGKPKSNPSFISIQEEREEKINELVNLRPRQVYMKVRGKGKPNLMRTITTPDYRIRQSKLEEFSDRIKRPYTRPRDEIRNEIARRRAQIEERIEEAVIGR